MADITLFLREVENVYKNHGIYLWAGNGELTEGLKIGTIRKQDISLSNAARVLRYIAKCYDNGYSMKESRAFDCSGLVVYALRAVGAIKQTTDYRAKDLQKISATIVLKGLIAGDLVFNKPADASHVGIYMGEDIVIECQGRDVGVTRRKLSAGSWVCGGRLPFFK